MTRQKMTLRILDLIDGAKEIEIVGPSTESEYMKLQVTKYLFYITLLTSLLSCQSLNSQEEARSAQEYTSLLCVRKDGKFGYINEMGVEVIPCIYDQPSSFHEGWTALKKGKNWAYYNAKGEKVLDLGKRFTHCGQFHDGAAFVTTTPTKKMLSIYASFWDDLCGNLQFIDRKGEILFKIDNAWDTDCSYVNALGFSDGLLKITHESQDGKKIGFLDKRGQVKSAFTTRILSGIKTTFSEGLIVAGKKKLDPHTDKERSYYGYQDPSGEWIIPPIYLKALPFKNGVAVVWEENPKRKLSYRTYLVDKGGERVFPNDIETNERLLRDSLLAVYRPVLNEDDVEVFGAFGQYRRYALAKIDGTLITDFIYADLQPGTSGEDPWIASLPEKKSYGCLDDSGNLVLPYQFPNIYFPFEYGLAVVDLDDDEQGRAVINTHGDIIFPTDADANYEIGAGVISTYVEEKFSYFNRDGQAIDMEEYEPAGIFEYFSLEELR